MSGGWDDDDPSVSELRAPRPDDEQPVRHRRRRPTRKWCRGKPGIEHQPAIRLSRYVESLQRYPLHHSGARSPTRAWRPACGWLDWSWRAFGDWRYLCRHERYCTACGKILARLDNTECPDYKPRPEKG